MTTISQVRACAPLSLVDLAGDLTKGNDTFATHVERMHVDVDTAMNSWQGDAASAAAARSVAAELAGKHISATVVTIAEVFESFGKQLDGYRAALLNIVDGDVPFAGLSVDDDGNVTAPSSPVAVASDSPMAQMVRDTLEGQAAGFQSRIKTLLVQFEDAENNAAGLITETLEELAGYVAGLDQAQMRAQVRDIVDGDTELPADPAALHDFWQTLTPAEKDALWQHDHSIGNRDGLSAADRDHYNRLVLTDELAATEPAATRAESLRAQHPDWARGENVPVLVEPAGVLTPEVLAFEAWSGEYEAAKADAKYFPDLQAVDKAVSVDPNRKLLLLDTHTGRQARAVVAVGDPDTADHVSVTTPGLNTTVHGSIESMTNEASNLNREALRQLRERGHDHDSVSTIAWIGYDPPQLSGSDGSGGVGQFIAGGWDVARDDLARTGAHNLAQFYDGIQAAHEGGRTDLTAIGHSYGSLTTGLALQEPGNHGVSRALFYGSPGIGANSTRDLQLQPGNVYAMETADDPIQYVFDAHSAGMLIPFLGPVLTSEFGDFGPNPHDNSEFTQLDTGPADVPDGHGDARHLAGAHGHSEYPRAADDGGLRTTNYNIASVVAGLGDQVVLDK